MRGQLLISFSDTDGFGGDYLDIFVNNVIRKRIYNTSYGLYSTPLYVNDVVTIQFSDSSPFTDLDFLINRIDYTTDDEGGDRGIKTTKIDTVITQTGTTFTATTLNISYDFEYKVNFDPTQCFYVGSGFTPDTTNSIVQLPNGKLVIVGQFTSYNGTPASQIIGLNYDGTVNTGFTYGSGLNGDGVRIETQSDGKLIIGGRFYTYNGTLSSKIVRINQDGSWDSSYSVSSGFTTGGTYTNTSLGVTSLSLQSDDKVVVAGSFDAYKGTSISGFCRLNTDASLDTTFSGITTGFNDTVNDIKIQSDGKILCCGTFTQYNGVTRNRIVRLNSDGSYDTSFSGITTGFNGQANQIEIQSDGKIIVVGQFSTFNGVTRNRIVRLNTNGSFDTSFIIGNTSGTGFNSEVQAACILSNGKIVCGGRFTAYSGITANKICGLNSNGTYDSTFVYGTGFGVLPSSEVTDIDQLSNGKLIVSGEFTTYNDIPAIRMVRLDSDGVFNNCT